MSKETRLRGFDRMTQRRVVGRPAVSSVPVDSACGCAGHCLALGRGVSDAGDQGSFPSLRDALWSGWLGGYAHPGSPAGGSGPGTSSQPGVLGPDFSGRQGNYAPLHPQSPAVRFATMDLGTPSRRGSKQSKGAGPQTKPATLKVKSGDQEVTVQILKDGHTETIPDETGRKRKDIARTRPSYSWKLDSNGQVQITIRIQTTYASAARAGQISGYGRGTTAADKAAGNTSLGFHESCHRQDYIEYLTEHPVPTVNSQDGGTQAFDDAIKSYFDEMGTYSVNKTDETGATKTEERQAEQSGRRAP